MATVWSRALFYRPNVRTPTAAFRRIVSLLLTATCCAALSIGIRGGINSAYRDYIWCVWFVLARSMQPALFPAGSVLLRCPLGCSGNGDCVEGSCFCFTNFTGPACNERER